MGPTNVRAYVRDMIPLREGIWDKETKICDVGPYRHTIQTPSMEEPTKVTFCNNCGNAFTIAGKCSRCGVGPYERGRT